MSTPLLPKVAEELSKAGYRKAIVAIRSKQLRAGLKRVKRGDSVWALHIPHFWAVYLNDGRKAVSPKTATYLVWFRDPKQDPRLNNGRTPERASQIRRLTQAQFKKFAAINRKKIKAYKQRTGKRILTSSDYASMNLPMVVVKQSPRSGDSVPGQHFFDNVPGGMGGFIEEASSIAKRMTSEHVMSTLRKHKLTGAGNTLLKKNVVLNL